MRTIPTKSRRVTHVVVPLLCIALGHLPESANAQRARTTRAPREILEELLKDTSWVEMLPPPIDSVAPNLVADPLDLNGDGVPALKISAIGYICGSPNNCPVWIYRRHGRGYERLLDAGSIALLEPQKTFTNGYRDIMTTMHGGAWDADLTLYKFDGREYRRSACFSWKDNFLDRHGNMHVLKKPRITAVECQR